jgi:hypothetical protein
LTANRDIPRDLEGEGKRLKIGSHCSGGEMIIIILDAEIVNKGRNDRKTSMEIKKPYAVVQYNKLMKGIDRADQDHSYYSVQRNTVIWSKKVVLYLLNSLLFNTYLCTGH